MAFRLIKIVLTLFVAAFCLLYALQNLVNLQAAYFFVATTAGMENHILYPNRIGPAIQSPFIIWLFLYLIIFLELTAGIAAFKGGVDMWRARHADSAIFHQAKKFAIIGAGIAVVIWFGIFSAIGGAYFQMWQTEAGAGALNGAFQYAVLNGVVLLIINTAEN